MDEVERSIAMYRVVTFDANGESWGKTNALKVLEEFLPDSRVLDFFLDIVADPAEYDMARVELIKLFEVDPFPAARQRIGECVAAALSDEKDWLVRCWLGRAVAAYSDIPGTRAVAIERVVDPAEDEDVRANCLSGLHGNEPEVLQALRQVAAEDSSLGSAARRRLAEAAEEATHDQADMPPDERVAGEAAQSV